MSRVETFRSEAHTNKGRLQRIPIQVRSPEQRVQDFAEVSLGYSPEMARQEAARCLQCRHHPCTEGCPVGINIPGFLEKLSTGDFACALSIIREDNTLPAICGRVCPQEIQCERHCTLGRQGDPVAIGALERFVADWERGDRSQSTGQPVGWVTGNKGNVAVVGSGPAGLTAAAELSRLGYKVTVFEALHTPGGVLRYGIPEFRLPKPILGDELDAIMQMGVEIRTNVLIGRTLTIDDLLGEGFQAVFLGTGAGLPQFLGIPGEDINGVYTANEFLTRVNLMKAYLYPQVDTPLYLGERVVVVGGGNTAMDAARTAIRLGSEVTIVYRRSRKDLPARREEIRHAEEEGVQFRFLSNPVRIMGDGDGWVKGIRCVKMALGGKNSSQQREVQPIVGSEYWLTAESVIVAIGQGPNPIISQTTPGLKVGPRGVIGVELRTFRTSREGVFAAGDVISGGATVIEAMGGGKKAAQAIDNYLRHTRSVENGSSGA